MIDERTRLEACEEDYDDLSKNFALYRKGATETRQFYMIALNLSGKREELESKAEALIDKHGMIKALKLSKPHNPHRG